MVLDRLTKSTHFIPIKSSYLAEDYEKIFIDEIVCRHGILLSIILDSGAQFTYRFWRSFQKGLGTKVKLITTFQPQVDNLVVCTIQTLEDMLRACVIDLKGCWDEHVPLVEFSYNNSYHSTYPCLLLKLYMVGDVDL